MTNFDLLKRIYELETQNLTLLAENKQLRAKLYISEENHTSEIMSKESVEKEDIDVYSINKYSSAKEKIE